MLLALTPELFRLILDYSVDDVWNQPGNIERALALRLVCKSFAEDILKAIGRSPLEQYGRNTLEERPALLLQLLLAKCSDFANPLTSQIEEVADLMLAVTSSAPDDSVSGRFKSKRALQNEICYVLFALRKTRDIVRLFAVAKEDKDPLHFKSKVRYSKYSRLAPDTSCCLEQEERTIFLAEEQDSESEEEEERIVECSIKQSGDGWDERTQSYAASLCYAVCINEPKAIAALLDDGGHPTTVSELFQKSPLLAAVAVGNSAAIHTLLAAPNINFDEEQVFAAANEANGRGCEEVKAALREHPLGQWACERVDLLISCPRYSLWYEPTPFIRIIKCGNFAIQLFQESMLQPSEEDAKLLVGAAARRRDVAMLKKLDYFGGRLKLSRHGMQTILIVIQDWVARGTDASEMVPIVQSWIEDGYNINQIYGCGRRTLMMLSLNQRGGCRIIELLLECRADTEIRDADGYTVLHQALNSWHLHRKEHILEVVKVLLKGGANIDARSPYDKTPLHFACENGYDDLFCLLLEECRARAGEDWTSRCDAFVNTRSGDGSTALHYAQKYCRKITIELLVSYGAEPYAKDKGGGTPSSMRSF